MSGVHGGLVDVRQRVKRRGRESRASRCRLAGVFVGGGIAPKILPALQDGTFIEAFRAKGLMSALVRKVPSKGDSEP